MNLITTAHTCSALFSTRSLSYRSRKLKGLPLKRAPAAAFSACALLISGGFLTADDPVLREGSLANPTLLAENSGNPISLVSRPVLGYLAQSLPLGLRAILGVPGAAVLSGPLALPVGVTRVWLAPGQAYVLVEQREDVPAVMPLNDGSVGQAVRMSAALLAPDFVVFSPSGQSAVLYSIAASRLQVIGGLPSVPRVMMDIGTGSFAEQPQNAAVSDDGRLVLLAAPGVVYQAQPNGLAKQVMGVSSSAALAFFPNSSQAAIADRTAGAVYLWLAAADTSSPALLARDLTGLGEVRATADGRGLWITNPGDKAVWWIGATTGEVRKFNVPVSPTRMDQLPATDMFLISSVSGQPTWIFFRQGEDAHAIFVPAVSTSRRSLF